MLPPSLSFFPQVGPNHLDLESLGEWLTVVTEQLLKIQPADDAETPVFACIMVAFALVN